LIPLERFAEKSAKNLIEAIQSQKKITFIRFIYALGIRNVGEETAFNLAEKFQSLENFKKSKLEDLEKVKDIGPIGAESIFDWFHKKGNLKFLEKLEKAGVRIEKPELQGKRLKLKGLIFVFTGGLGTLTRDAAKEKIRELGGEVSESVSSKTDFVVVGKDLGSKFKKAEKLGIKTLREKEFLKVLE